MSGHRWLDTRSGIGASALRVAALGTVFIGALAGCTDHRISLVKFQEIEEEQARKVPATQPATTPEQAKAVIDQALGPYKVGPGDVLHVVLTGVGQDMQIPPLDVRLDRNGDVELPGVGKVHVGGLVLEDAEHMLREAYVPKVYRETVVHLSTVEAETTNVLVVGAVTLPGLAHLKRTERNLLYAIVAAGGVSDQASGEVLLRRIRRPGDSSKLQLTEPQGLQVALGLEPLETGDIVTVHAATPNTIFVGGLVNAPRPQIFPQGVPVTVLQALAGSGGLRTDVTPREATLIRRMPGGRDVHVKLDLDRMTTGRDPNITLAAGDILWVPDTVETRVQDWINKNVFFRVGANATAGYSANYNMNGVDYLNKAAKSQFGRSTQSSSLMDQFDPFGFLLQNQALQQQSQLLQNPSGP